MPEVAVCAAPAGEDIALMGLRADLSEAVELVCRLAAKRFSAFPYFGPKHRDLFLVVREFLAKHDRLPK